jgi:hypothetical protein
MTLSIASFDLVLESSTGNEPDMERRLPRVESFTQFIIIGRACYLNTHTDTSHNCQNENISISFSMLIKKNRMASSLTVSAGIHFVLPFQNIPAPVQEPFSADPLLIPQKIVFQAINPKHRT